ncbi:NAD(P)-binding protein [Pyrenochaeta sp. DS3sAY3a]|nr:NAD(P)-binding protein [Pyrenochaeta sp. DS3sAY3a]
MAQPTILIAGATGNTGQETVRTLSRLLSSSKVFSHHRLLAQTRSAKSTAAQQLAQLPHVEVVEYAWPEITAQWLKDHHVVRAFIASHNQPNHFAEESTLHCALLAAGVEYVVRISTTAANVTPVCKAYYPRTHWAIEALLSAPEFSNLHWTSLQPNVFTNFVLGPAAALVKADQQGEKQEMLRLLLSEDAPVGVIHPDDVGNLAARLLLEPDSTKHNKAKLVLNGPEDVTGRQVVALLEKTIGTKVESVSYGDLSFVDVMAVQSSESKNVISSIKFAAETSWEGKASVATTSKEVLEIAPATRTVADTWKEMLGV